MRAHTHIKIPSTPYFVKLFPKVWINAEHRADEQLMAHKQHGSSLILRWDLTPSPYHVLWYLSILRLLIDENGEEELCKGSRNK